MLVVENLRNPDALDSALKGLGARHVKYGALPEHYPLVGSALLTTFQQYLGNKWTPEVKQAWVGAYGAISEIMLDGADYTQTDIALEPEPNQKAESSNTEIAVPDAKLLTKSANNSGVGTAVVSTSESAEFTHDSGKATVAAFAGGGIMAIIATILALLI